MQIARHAYYSCIRMICILQPDDFVAVYLKHKSKAGHCLRSISLSITEGIEISRQCPSQRLEIISGVKLRNGPHDDVPPNTIGHLSKRCRRPDIGKHIKKCY